MNELSMLLNNKPIGYKIMLAQRFDQRLRGLTGCGRLDVGEGLLLSPGGSVHTLGMSFAIDVIFIDRRGVVLKTCMNLAPNRAGIAPMRTHRTLELSAGACAELGLQPGNRIDFKGCNDASAA